MSIFENDIIKGIIKFFKDIDFSPDFSDPQTKLSLILFSTEALILLISVILWFFAVLFKPVDKWGIKEQQGKKDPDKKTYNYHDKAFIPEKEQGFLTVFISKFVFPVIVIFGIIYIGVSIFGVRYD